MKMKDETTAAPEFGLGLRGLHLHRGRCQPRPGVNLTKLFSYAADDAAK
jgi:hypothetical protein